MLPLALEQSWLALPAHEGARRLALHQLSQAEALSAAFDVEQETALHDLRVALRRLRSTLKSYQAAFETLPRKKTLRKLAKAVRQTGRGRDAEVQVDWIDAQLSALAENEQAGARAFRDQRNGEKSEGYSAILAEALPALKRSLRALRPELAEYSVTHIIDEEGRHEPSFGELFERSVSRELDGLESDLRALRGIDDDESVHDIRIRGKRLRYLLEPFRELNDETKVAVKQLRRLQEVLGDLHDAALRADLLAQAIEAAALKQARRAVRNVVAQNETAPPEAQELGLLALLRLTHAERVVRYESLRKDFLDGAALDQLRASIDGAVAKLIPKPSLEIERKYLLRGLPPEAAKVKPLVLEQGYVPGGKILERVRRTSQGRAQSFTRTMKLGTGVARIEVEESISRSLYQKLFALTEGRRVRKHRHEVTDGSLVWQIDAFLDRSLFLAEVELESEDTIPTFPEWLKPWVVREVTEEAAYVNARLAK